MATIYDLYSQTTTRKEIQDYYNFRGLKYPDTAEALFFLTTELAELWDALIDSGSMDMPDDLMPTYYSLRSARAELERYLRRDGGFIRNNEPSGEASEADEVGDVLMMLEVLAMVTHLPDAKTCMMRKFAKKGFTP